MGLTFRCFQIVALSVKHYDGGDDEDEDDDEDDEDDDEDEDEDEDEDDIYAI